MLNKKNNPIPKIFFVLQARLDIFSTLHSVKTRNMLRFLFSISNDYFKSQPSLHAHEEGYVPIEFAYGSRTKAALPVVERRCFHNFSLVVTVINFLKYLWGLDHLSKPYTLANHSLL